MHSTVKSDKYIEFGSTQDVYTVEIRPLTKCNYNCYYCTDNRINSNPIIKLNTDNIKKIITTARRVLNKRIHVYIIGGEPTLYTEISKLVNDITDSLQDMDRVEIQTNLSRSKEWFGNFIDKLKRPEFVIISASYHNTQVKDFDEFLDKCTYVRDRNILGSVSVMYNKKQNVIAQYKLLRTVLSKERCTLSFLVEPNTNLTHAGPGEVVDDKLVTDEVRYIAENENLEELKELSPEYFEDTLPYKTNNGESGKISKFNLWLERKNDFSGQVCEIEQDCIFIDWSGNCYKCTSDQFSSVPPVFNIQSKDFCCESYFNNLSSMICPYTWCCPFGIAKHKKYGKQQDVELIKADVKYNRAEYIFGK